MHTLWFSIVTETTLWPIFIAVGVITILVFLVIIILKYSHKLNPENDLPGSGFDHVLLLLLLVAVFTLGAFIMYVLLL